MFPKSDTSGSEGPHMTRSSIAHPVEIVADAAVCGEAGGNGAARTAAGRSRPGPAGRRRPCPQRPPSAATRYRGAGVRLSRAPHRRTPARPVTPLTVIGLALLAGAITVWLGVVAQFGESVRATTAPIPDRLAVVQVQAGETLQRVAARVAPDAPVGSVVARIRELNELDSPVVDAGQTLIAPLG
jgi:hypothetical protein